MKTKEEIKEWILENCKNNNGDIDLSHLDFSDFDGDIFITNMRVKNDIYQGSHKVGGNLYQSSHKVEKSLYQKAHTVGFNLDQSMHKVGRGLIQGKQTVAQDLSQRNNNVGGNLLQSDNKVGKNLVQKYNVVGGNLYQTWNTVKGNLIQTNNEVKGDLYQHLQKVKGDIVETKYWKINNVEYTKFDYSDGVKTAIGLKTEKHGLSEIVGVNPTGRRSFIAKMGPFSFHSYLSLKEAKKGLKEKIANFKENKEEIVKKIKKQNYVTREDFRELTGACNAGIHKFCEENNISEEQEKISVELLISIFKKNTKWYGAKEFIKYMEWNDETNNEI